MREAAASVSSGPDPMNIALVDNTSLFGTHMLCQQGATREKGAGNPPPPSTRNTTEWVRVISVLDAKFRSDKDAMSEPMHPMYWGQRALAGCNGAAAVASVGSGLTKFSCALALRGCWRNPGRAAKRRPDQAIADQTGTALSD